VLVGRLNRRRVVKDEIDREGAIGQLAGPLDDPPRRFEVLPGHGERAQATGVRDGGSEFWSGEAADRGLDDRVLDPEAFCERRRESGHIRRRAGTGINSVAWIGGPLPTGHLEPAMRGLVERLREEAQRADERRLLVLAGDAASTRAAALDALEAADIDSASVTAIGTAEDLSGTPLDPQRSGELLGTTQPAVVVDCHEACRPNAIGRAVGAVDGGGLLVLLTPPLETWADRRDAFDESLAVPPFDVADVAGHFRAHLVGTLRSHAGVAIVNVDAEGDDEIERRGLTGAPARTPPAPPTPPTRSAFPDETYEACLTADQVRAVSAFEDFREANGGAVVLESDRGRGKSSAAGLAAAALALDGRDVLVTAPDYRNAGEVFERAHHLLVDLGELADRDVADAPRCLATETGRIRFAEPVAATDLPDDPDVVVVDEAAALPVRLLEAFLEAGAVAYATTIHGYEGAGRGFSVRFRDRLAESDLPVTDVRLSTPIRFASGDPVEIWSFRALALNAGPSPDQVVGAATPESVSYHELRPADLLADEALLREAFGLLVLAHYRTEPNDLARLLDAPNVTTRALVLRDHVVAVALLAREGDLDDDRRASMYEGERVRGNMLPDVLLSQIGASTGRLTVAGGGSCPVRSGAPPRSVSSRPAGRRPRRSGGRCTR